MLNIRNVVNEDPTCSWTFLKMPAKVMKCLLSVKLQHTRRWPQPSAHLHYGTYGHRSQTVHQTVPSHTVARCCKNSILLTWIEVQQVLQRNSKIKLRKNVPVHFLDIRKYRNIQQLEIDWKKFQSIFNLIL